MKDKLSRRLLPLYIAAFFQGYVIWYATEKVFMKTIGYNDATIGIVTAAIALVAILFEAPSGILADRWSRKGVLLIASLFLMFSSLLGGISNTIWMYFLGTGSWAVFFAFYSGTYDTIVYDTLLEENNSAKGFEKYFGRIRVIDSIALVFGSLSNVVVAHYFGLRTTFFLTIPFSFLSILALMKFKEPKLHKKSSQSHWLHHSLLTLKSVTKGPTLLWIVFVSVFIGVGLRIIFEFSQLWYIALAIPIVFFGLLSAQLHTTIGIGGFLAKKINSRKITTLSFALLFIFSFGFLINAVAVVMISVFVCCTSLMALDIIILHKLHDNIESGLRAGAASTVSSISQIIFIPVSILFGFTAQRLSIFHAGLFIVGSTFLVLVGHLLMTKNKKSAKLAR